MSEHDAGWPHIRRAESVIYYPTENIINWSVREATFFDGDISRHLVGFIPSRSGC